MSGGKRIRSHSPGRTNLRNDSGYNDLIANINNKYPMRIVNVGDHLILFNQTGSV